jgi:HK97 gp10 family phage protein
VAQAGQITIRIEGIDHLRGKLNDSRADAPIKRFLDRGAIYIQGQARMKAPVDTGVLRNSIGVEDAGKRTREIGTNKTYGPYVEFGTRPHFVPKQYIGGWARRHGLGDTGLLVSGKAQPFMKPAADTGEPFVKGLVPLLAAELEASYAE